MINRIGVGYGTVGFAAGKKVIDKKKLKAAIEAITDIDRKTGKREFSVRKFQNAVHDPDATAADCDIFYRASKVVLGSK